MIMQKTYKSAPRRSNNPMRILTSLDPAGAPFTVRIGDEEARLTLEDTTDLARVLNALVALLHKEAPVEKLPVQGVPS